MKRSMSLILLTALQGLVVLFVLWQLTQAPEMRNSQTTIDLLRVCLILSLIPSFYLAKSFCAAKETMLEKILVFIVIFPLCPFLIDLNSISLINRYVIVGLGGCQGM